MLDYAAGCPQGYVATPNPKAGPWCQGINEGCCANNPYFEFTTVNKNGNLKVLGNCDFVAEKPKNRCKKIINDVKVGNECSVACSLPKCTCNDRTTSFKFDVKGKTLRRNCASKKVKPSKFCKIAKVADECPVQCKLQKCSA